MKVARSGLPHTHPVGWYFAGPGLRLCYASIAPYRHWHGLNVPPFAAPSGMSCPLTEISLLNANGNHASHAHVRCSDDIALVQLISTMFLSLSIPCFAASCTEYGCEFPRRITTCVEETQCHLSSSSRVEAFFRLTQPLPSFSPLICVSLPFPSFFPLLIFLFFQRIPCDARPFLRYPSPADLGMQFLSDAR